MDFWDDENAIGVGYIKFYITDSKLAQEYFLPEEVINDVIVNDKFDENFEIEFKNGNNLYYFTFSQLFDVIEKE